MDSAVLMSMAKGVGPALIAGVVACAAVAVARKGKPEAHMAWWWIVPALLGLGCAAGAAWSGGAWKPGAGASSWLATMAVAAGVAGVVRGESDRAGAAAVVVRFVALGAAAWMTVRSIAAMGELERWAWVAGTGVAGTALCAALERVMRESAGRAAAWPACATAMIVTGAASQVLVIGMTVQTAAWMSAGVSAFLGVCLAAGLATRRVIAGHASMSAAAVLLCGLLVHGWQTGAASDNPWEAAVMVSLLALGAGAPVVAAVSLRDKGRGWVGVAAAATASLAAVIAAVVVRPPPFDV